ncbi:MAG: glycosyltransferase family 39 protein [Gammaproteobacteria bacterium]|nr:glycosyltransferase family 39 protein [Gammaproteobacteria bacterium]
MKSFLAKDRSWLTDLLWLSLVIGIVSFITLGIPSLFTPDEGRYAEIPREMLASGNFIIPHLDGVIYFEKPPLIYWLTAFFMHCFGYSEWAVRTINGLFSVLGCLSIYAASRKLFNRRTGILAALIASSSLLYISINHMLTMDAGLSFFMTLSLLSFMLGLRATHRTKQSLWFWAAYLCAGLAFLCKGLIGIVFPMMIIGLWILLLNRWYVLKQMRIVSGLMLFLAVTLPWLILTQHAVPTFFHEFFIIEEFARYATPVEHRHMALLSYIAVLVLGFFPWTVWIVQSIRYNLPTSWKLRQLSAEPLFLVVWAGAITLFFACSHSILIPYLLPIIPPLAILTARYIDSHWELGLNKSQKISISLFIAICIIISFALIVLPKFQFIARPHLTYPLLVLTALSFLIAGLMSLYFWCRNQFKKLIITMVVLPWFIMNLVWVASPYIVNRSIQPLAADLKPLLQQNPAAVVVSFRTYYQDLPYYIQRKVVIIDWQDELQYGLDTDPQVKTWMYDDAGLWKMWSGPQTVYMIMSQGDYQAQSSSHRLYVIDQTSNDVLITNRKP